MESANAAASSIGDSVSRAAASADSASQSESNAATYAQNASDAADRVGTADQIEGWVQQAQDAADRIGTAEQVEGWANEARTSASSAAADTAVALREEMKPITQANAAYMGQSLAASQIATDAANAAKASEDKAKSWAELAETSGTSALARLDVLRAWFRGEGPPPAEIPGARVGDWWLDTSTMELHEITAV